jgi:putative AdoMet-dependent methyltransferase
MSEDNGQQLFDGWAEHYDQSVRRGGFPLEGYDRVIDEIVRVAQAWPGMEVLDLGIGTGNLAIRFGEKACRLWGLDFSAAMLARAARKVPGATLVQAALDGPWPPELQRRFDRVVSAYAFHHLDLAAKARTLHRISLNHLSSSGQIIIGDVAFPTREERERAHERWIELWDEDEYYWAADETRVACEEIGLICTYTQISSCGGVFSITGAR